jgi:hypothetical protein
MSGQNQVFQGLFKNCVKKLLDDHRNGFGGWVVDWSVT